MSCRETNENCSLYCDLYLTHEPVSTLNFRSANRYTGDLSGPMNMGLQITGEKFSVNETRHVISTMKQVK
jgi:hypothetical protein